MRNKTFSIIGIIIVLIAGGYFAWQYFVTDETADWKIYRNEKYGYEIKYPSDWKLNTRPDSKWIDIATVSREKYLDGVGTPAKGNAWAMLTVFSPGEEFEEFTKKEENYGEAESDDFVQILSAKRLVSKEGTIVIRALMGYWKGDQSALEYDQIFDRMLPTLRFLE